MDDPKNFQVLIPTNETTRSGTKKKKPRMTHDKDSMYPPTYARYKYEVSLQWYARKSVQFLEASYLRDLAMGNEKLVDDLEASILSKCYKSEDFKDMDLMYNSKLKQWLTNVIQTIIFNTKRLMNELHLQVMA